MIISAGINNIFDCEGYDSAGVKGQGVGKVGVASDPISLNIYFTCPVATVGVATAPVGVTSAVVDGYAAIGIASAPDEYVERIEHSWVWTSRIGSMDFDEGLSGEVTKQPMSWYGYVYQIIKIAVGAVVLGQNGITLMVPSGVIWGKKDIYPIGIKGKGSAVKTRKGITFIDREGHLGTIAENGQISVVDYSNYFDAMSAALVMSYDESLDIIYIADGTYGFILSESGLGKGPAMISGMGNKSGTLYATAQTALVFAPFEITTDIQDFGVRSEKTITGFELGTNVTGNLYGAVDYRWDKAGNFFSSPWVKADRFGRVSLMVSGIEFKFKVRLTTYEAMRLDYIKVQGVAYDAVGIA